MAMTEKPVNGTAPSSSMLPHTPTSDTTDTDSSTVKLKRTLGLFNGVALIVGSIVGSGIFVSPKGVLMEAESVGLSLIIWLLCGIICLLGALSFAELGTCITRSGGMYAYILVAFGDLPAFVYMWASLLIIYPAANAVIALTFGYYCLQPLFPDCDSPDIAVRILAALALGLLSFINCMSVRWATCVQNVFTILKTLALVIIIITGVVVLAQGHTINFSNPFDDSTRDLGKISLAFYSGLFSYSGWYTLNFLTEELKNPYQNLPRAIWISIPAVTIIYFLANVAYFAVLTPAQIIESDAVAVTFAARMFGKVAWCMPLFVAFSTFGSLNGCILCTARVFFVGARQGHLPDVIALIHMERFTPFPSVFLQAVISVAMLVTSDVYLLINYVTFIESLSFFVCAIALLWLRYKHPEWTRPIKVNLALPIIFTFVCLFLLVFPLYQSPLETLVGLFILLSGIPVYCVCVVWKGKPKTYTKYITRMNHFVQKLILGVMQEGDID